MTERKRVQERTTLSGSGTCVEVPSADFIDNAGNGKRYLDEEHQVIAENERLDDGLEDANLLTAGDLARRLRVSLRQVRKLHSEALMPEPVRLGRSVRWRGSEVGKWIEAGCPNRETWKTMQNGQRGSEN